MSKELTYRRHSDRQFYSQHLQPIRPLFCSLRQLHSHLSCACYFHSYRQSLTELHDVFCHCYPFSLRSHHRCRLRGSSGHQEVIVYPEPVPWQESQQRGLKSDWALPTICLFQWKLLLQSEHYNLTIDLFSLADLRSWHRYYVGQMCAQSYASATYSSQSWVSSEPNYFHMSQHLRCSLWMNFDSNDDGIALVGSPPASHREYLSGRCLHVMAICLLVWFLKPFSLKSIQLCL